MAEEPFSIVWSAYLQYRATQRGYDLAKIEEIVKYSDERYFDTVTHRVVVVGKHDDRLVAIPIEREADSITPVHSCNNSSTDPLSPTEREIYP
jgi:hypothetical protein